MCDRKLTGVTSLVYCTYWTKGISNDSSYYSC